MAAPTRYRDPTAADERPVVVVPHAKVALGEDAGSAVVTYTLRIRYCGCTWEVDRRFSEIKEFDGELSAGKGLPPLPPHRGAHWRVNRRLELISQRRRALHDYFAALALNAGADNLRRLLSFVLARWHMSDMGQRDPDATQWHSVFWYGKDDAPLTGDEYDSLVGGPHVPTTADLPADVRVCTPAATLVADTIDGCEGVRIAVKARRAEVVRGEMRRRVVEGRAMYVCLRGEGGRVPGRREVAKLLKVVAYDRSRDSSSSVGSRRKSLAGSEGQCGMPARRGSVGSSVPSADSSSSLLTLCSAASDAATARSTDAAPAVEITVTAPEEGPLPRRRTPAPAVGHLRPPAERRRTAEYRYSAGVGGDDAEDDCRLAPFTTVDHTGTPHRRARLGKPIPPKQSPQDALVTGTLRRMSRVL